MIKRSLTFGVLIAALAINSQAFPAQFTIAPALTASGEYTDNVDLTKDNKKDDFIIFVSAGLTAELRGKTSGASLSTSYGYSFYDQNSSNDTFRIPLNFRAWTQPSKYTELNFTNQFLRTEDPNAQDQIVVQDGRLEETGDTTVRRGRKPYYTNTATLNATHRFGKEDRVYGGFTYGLLRNKDDQVQDNDYYRPSAGLDYWFTHRFGSQFFAEYTRAEYSQSSNFVGVPAGEFDNWLGSMRLLGRMTNHFALFFQYNQVYRHWTSGDENDYLVYAASAGLTYNITKDLFFLIGPGYYYQQIENEQNTSNPFLNAELSQTWDFRRGSVKLAGLAGLTQNNFGAQPNFDFQQFAAIQGSAGYNFTSRLIGDTGASYRWAFTPARNDQGGVGEDATTNLFQFRLGLSYLPTRWMSLRLGYSFNGYVSDVDPDYTENRALLTVTLRPDRPWRF